MISVEEALAEILSHVGPLEPERIPILEALGRVLAEGIVSDIDIPPFDNSAMDGYAVRAADVAGAPARLAVKGSVAAGYVAAARLEPGTAIRIMTGAPMPEGTDAVVPFEGTSDADRSKEARLAGPATEIEVRVAVKPRDHVRPTGEDVRRGEQVMAPGRVIRAQEIGVLASLGRATVMVHRRPRVRLVVSGNELLPPGTPPEGTRIADSNSPMLAALVERDGGVVEQLCRLPDDEAARLQAVKDGVDAPLAELKDLARRSNRLHELISVHRPTRQNLEDQEFGHSIQKIGIAASLRHKMVVKERGRLSITAARLRRAPLDASPAPLALQSAMRTARAAVWARRRAPAKCQ